MKIMARIIPHIKIFLCSEKNEYEKTVFRWTALASNKLKDKTLNGIIVFGMHKKNIKCDVPFFYEYVLGVLTSFSMTSHFSTYHFCHVIVMQLRESFYLKCLQARKKRMWKWNQQHISYFLLFGSGFIEELKKRSRRLNAMSCCAKLKHGHWNSHWSRLHYCRENSIII